MTESAFATELLKWAKVYGWHRYHVRNSGYRGQSFVQGDKGFPDLVLCRPPRLIFAELKMDKKKPRPEQQDWLRVLRTSGVEVYVWQPRDWSSILVTLSRSWDVSLDEAVQRG